ncbi:DoxX family protein [Nocardia puris]|nr:DoxX family protein [Nocardia puris]MBF6212553.1 DoxX family protein [Nocardia puris]MBF6369133.1 DoxX family protein [Nocardia puris]MBF6463334.1 DoxX family protein [Nocardia puris]
MSATQVLERIDDVDPVEVRPWHPLARIVFRFCFSYFTLFCLVFAQILFVFTGYAARWLPDDAIVWQMRATAPLTEWVGEHIFGVEAVLHMSGSGDQTVFWVLVATVLAVAVLVTAVWSIADRRRPAYPTLAAWFVTGMRLCLGGQMLLYGSVKAVPNQMPYPELTTLLEPYGNLSLMGVLWNQVGVSPAYQVLLGTAEVLGGLLLFLPRTATAGALLSLVSMAQVFVLNMTYDVPVKILSFHLVLLSLIVLAPQAKRLLNFLVLQRVTEPAVQPKLFGSARANRIAAVVQVALGLWVCAGAGYGAWVNWREYGYGAPKPELYGIWDVTEFAVEGTPVPPLTTDEYRWQRLIIDTQLTSYQRMDDTMVPTVTDIDAEARTITVNSAADGVTRVAVFTYDRPDPDRLVLRGEIEGRPVALTLEEFDLDSLPLRGDRFHWVQNAPEN